MRGFTLFELVLVIVVIGILAIVVVPRLGTNNEMVDQTKAVDYARYAQHLAMIDDGFWATKKYWRKSAWCVMLSDNNISVYKDIYDNNGFVKRKLAKVNGKEMIFWPKSEVNDTKSICFDEIGRPYLNNIELSNLLKKPIEIRIGNGKIRIVQETGYITFVK